MQSNKKEYTVIKKLGSGTFGQVYEAIKNSNQEIVAIKRTPYIGSEESDEVKILKKLQNFPNMVQLKDYFFSYDSDNNQILNIVMEKGDCNLQQLIQKKKQNAQFFTEKQIIAITEEILIGLNILHELNIVHRDIKPNNILSFGDKFKICDFGISKILKKDGYNCPTVGAQIYRAPELVLGANYDYKVDMWSLGCIIVELITLQPIFKVKGQENQFLKILSIIGGLNDEFYQYYQKQLEPTFFEKLKQFPSYSGLKISKLIKFYGIEFKNTQILDLVQKLLILIPEKRISSKEALKHQCFSNPSNSEQQIKQSI